jgi:hypothetical protein
VSEDGLEWVPTLYDGIESAWSPEDGAYLARWSRGNGLLHWVTTHGYSREDAVRHLVEMAPDIMLCLHSGEDDALQQFRKLKIAVEELYYAAHWTPDRECDADDLWTRVRDAAGFTPGETAARLPTPDSEETPAEPQP